MFKKRKERPQNEINAGSMADIAFLLLIFFLVSTTVLEDKGITVKLPPWEEDVVPKPTNEDNVFSVKVNKLNQLLVEGEEAPVVSLRERTKEFIMNPNQRDDLPTLPKNAIISLQNDRGTEYETYLAVYNELKGAYNELWDDASRGRYGKAWEDLNKVERRDILNDIPLVISEAEPTDLVLPSE